LWISGVRLSNLGLGFHSLRRREKREEKRENVVKKNERNRVGAFYIRRWTGWVLTRSSAPCFGPLDLDPNGSRSIQRLRGVLEIRIHPPAWVWAGYPRLFCFLFSFLTFLLCAPCSCYLDHLCVLISSQKSQKITTCSWYVFDCFVIFLHV